jgi:hypothetical protein
MAVCIDQHLDAAPRSQWRAQPGLGNGLILISSTLQQRRSGGRGNEPAEPSAQDDVHH